MTVIVLFNAPVKAKTVSMTVFQTRKNVATVRTTVPVVTVVDAYLLAMNIDGEGKMLLDFADK